MSVELSLPHKIVHPTNKIENNDFQSQSGYANTNMLIKLPYEGMSWLSRAMDKIWENVFRSDKTSAWKTKNYLFKV